MIVKNKTCCFKGYRVVGAEEVSNIEKSLISYLRKDAGGTAYTVRYAKERGSWCYTNIKKPFKASPLNELTKLVYHTQEKISTDRINKIFFDYLYILRIDICPRLVYNVARRKTKTHEKPWSSREWKGTDSDENRQQSTRTFN